MAEKAFTAFKDTKATQKVFQLTKKIRAVSGGTSASKTISILVWIIDYAQNTQNKVVTIVGESVPHLNLGAKRDFMNIMVSNGYWKDSNWAESGVYTFEGGTIVEFISFDKFGKAHGPRRDVLFLNEANYLPYKIVDQLITRTRKVVWMDWNPTADFWFYDEMLNKRPIDFIGDGGNYPPLTYKDNDALDQDSIDEIEAHTNPAWRKVYIEGKRGEIEGKIYRDWQIIDEIPFGARLERYGLDFGYSNDPTAIVAIYYFNGGYILDEICFTKGLSNKQIADIILNQPKKALTIADSAEPKSIDEIRAHGVLIQPTVKGKDSVLQGIQAVQDQPISVTKQSVNVIKEYRNYLWETDKEGRVLNVPEHTWSHSMDAIRYGMNSLIPSIQKRDFIANMPRIMDNREHENPAW
jgi:phage terminase large subunit